MIKKLLYPFLSAFLVYYLISSIQLLSSVSPEKLDSMNIGVFSISIPLLVSGVFGFTGFAYPTHKIIPSSYFKIKNGNLLIRVYRIMGVEYFKFALMIFFWGFKKNRKKYFNGTKKGIKNFIYQTKQSEFGHLGALIVTLPISLYLGLIGHIYIFFFSMISNTLINLYPIILQRHHRLRVERIKF